jgi:hypothetical protein
MFFIYDCNDQVAGNPKGYRTFRGANQQANGRKSKLYHTLWDRYYAKREADPECRLVTRITIQEEVESSTYWSPKI